MVLASHRTHSPTTTTGNSNNQFLVAWHKFRVMPEMRSTPIQPGDNYHLFVRMSNICQSDQFKITYGACWDIVCFQFTRHTHSGPPQYILLLLEETNIRKWRHWFGFIVLFWAKRWSFTPNRINHLVLDKMSWRHRWPVLSIGCDFGTVIFHVGTRRASAYKNRKSVMQWNRPVAWNALFSRCSKCFDDEAMLKLELAPVMAGQEAKNLQMSIAV